MADVEWDRVKTVFQQALDQPPGARAAWVDAACESDHHLRDDVRALLTAYEQTPTFMEAPAIWNDAVVSAVAAVAEASVWIGRRIGAYRIVRELGRGGMGRVFLAERADRQFDRQVAIKIVRQTADVDLLLDRFTHERRILAAFDHANIARLLDAGATDEGIPYVVMEYVDGAPIDDYCERRELTTDARLTLFRQVCLAVDHAHQHSVIHRDLKPANILVTEEGVPKLLDFGIAKLVEPSSSDRSQTRTADRVLTPASAAPEQVTGGPITPATDVYALGVLLCQLMTGRLPYHLPDTSEAELGRAICETVPQKPSTLVDHADGLSSAQSTALRKRLTGDIDTIVLKALRKEPERRYASAAELAEDIGRHLEGLPVHAAPDTVRYRTRKFLRRQRLMLFAAAAFLAVVSAAMIVLVITADFRRRPNGDDVANPGATRSGIASLPGPGVRTLVVLPFQVIGASEDKYLGLGIADTLITKLGNLRGLTVRPMSAVQRYADEPADPIAVGRAQKVDAVLDGAIQIAGANLRVNVRLIRVADSAPLWGEAFDEGTTNLLAVQDAISLRVVQTLALQLTAEERRRLEKRDTDNVDASRTYHKARYFWNKRTRDALKKSAEYFEQAISQDRGFALAYAGLADSYSLMADYEAMPAREAYPRAKRAVQQALLLDDTLAEAHASLGAIQASYDWDWAGAEQSYRTAIARKPHYATAHQWYAELLSGMGRHDEAMAEITRAQELDPLSLIINASVAWNLYFGRSYDKVVLQCQRVLELEPNFGEAYAYLQRAYEQKGMYGEALVALRKESLLMGYDTNVRPEELIPRVIGADEYWRARLALARVSVPGGYRIVPHTAAEAHTQLGHHDQAIQWLEKLIENRGYWVMYLGVVPTLDPLRSDPRFQQLLRRVKLIS